MQKNHVHGIITVLSVFATSTALAIASLSAGCASTVDGASIDGKRLPVAVLQCPDHVDPGASFTLDGSGSSDDTAFASVALTLEPGHLSATSLKADFHVDNAAIATARLVVTDADKNTAEARCRFAVGDPNAGPPSLPPPPPPDDPATDPNAGDPNGGGDPTTQQPPPAIDLTGKFALVAYDRPKMGGLVLYPATQCGAGPEVSLVDITQTGYHVSMNVTTCSIGLSDVQIDVLGWQTVETSQIPDVVMQSLPSTGPIEFDLDDADVGSRFAVPADQLKPQIVGANVTDPNGALPSDGSDPTVIDVDNDGNPGVTIQNTELDTGDTYDEYVVMRHSIRSLAGTIQSADEIDGSENGDWRADSDMTLLSPFSMFVPTGQGLPSTFKMTRVDGATTCDQIRSDVAQYLASLQQPSPPQDCPQF